MDITGTQILIEWAGPGNLGFTGSAFNGFEFLFTGVTITGATVDGSSTFLERPALSIVGNNIFLNYSGENTGNGPTTSIIDLTTSASSLTDPGSLVLLGT